MSWQKLDNIVKEPLNLPPPHTQQLTQPSKVLRADGSIEEAKTVFEDTYLAFLNKCKDHKQVIIKDIVHLIKVMQSNEMDCHIVIAGQNGVGKSIILQMLMKEFMAGKPWIQNLFLADKTTEDFVQFLLLRENTILGIDELNQYMYYKQHSDADQNHLIKQLELARSRRIAVAGCVRDPRKLTLNYRQGKMSIVVWIVDRYIKGGSYAAVFVANPAVESADKFGFNWIVSDMIDFEELRVAFESLPSFIGYMRIPNANEILTNEEMKEYRHAKDSAMAFAHLNFCIKKTAGKKMTVEDFGREVDSLVPIIGKEAAAKYIENAVNHMKSKTARGKTAKEILEDYEAD